LNEREPYSRAFNQQFRAGFVLARRNKCGRYAPTGIVLRHSNAAMIAEIALRRKRRSDAAAFVDR
jgi:hypothetical protein